MSAGREGFLGEGEGGDLLSGGYFCDAHITNYDMKGRSCPLHIVIHSHHILKIFCIHSICICYMHHATWWEQL